MSRISFQDTQKSQTSVGKILSSVLPAHRNLITTTGPKVSTKNSKIAIKKKATLSTSQIINAQQKKIDPETLRRLQKKQKIKKKKEVRQLRETKERLDSKARFEVLKKHHDEGTLSPKEKSEYKMLIMKNIANVESWKNEMDDEVVDVQKEILELRGLGVRRKEKRKSQAIKAKELYDKKGEKRYPGLTPGLAPVGMGDSDDEDEF